MVNDLDQVQEETKIFRMQEPFSGLLMILFCIFVVGSSAPEASAAGVFFTSFELDHQLGSLSGSATAGGWHEESGSACFAFTPRTGSRFLHEGTDSGNYASSVQYHHYTLPPQNLAGSFGAVTLSLFHWQRLEGKVIGSVFDGANVKISTDGGVSWALLTPVGGYSDAAIQSMDDVSENEPGWGQDNGGWEMATFDLTSYAGQTDVRIRFVFSSDVDGEDCGFAIDDVSITTSSLAEEIPALSAPLHQIFAGLLVGVAMLTLHLRRRRAGLG